MHRPVSGKSLRLALDMPAGRCSGARSGLMHARPVTTMNPRNNGLLSILPETEYNAFAGQLKRVFLRKGDVLFEAGEVPRHVWYPVGAVVSMMIDSAEGEPLETCMFGKTCMVGVATLGQPSFYRAQVRSAGAAYQLPVTALGSLRSVCPTYCRHAADAVNRMVMQLSLSLVCSKHHLLEQQLIRWLLITLDRSTSPCIRITHQELSQLLGVRREAVTLTLRTLVERHAIDLRRGVLEVLDRPALEARSCECYWTGEQKVRPPSLPAANVIVTVADPALKMRAKAAVSG